VGRKWWYNQQRRKWRCWSHRRRRSYKRVGTRPWRTASRNWVCMCQVSHKRHCSNTVDHRKLRTRFYTPRPRRCSSPSAPRGTACSGPPRTPSRCSFRRRFRPGAQRSLGGCNRRPDSRRRNPARRLRSAWTLRAWQAGRRYLRRIPRWRSHSRRWRRRISRRRLGSRGTGPRGGRTRRVARRQRWTRRAVKQSRWWRAARIRRWIISRAIQCSCTCSQWWMSLNMNLFMLNTTTVKQNKSLTVNTGSS